MRWIKWLSLYIPVIFPKNTKNSWLWPWVNLIVTYQYIRDQGMSRLRSPSCYQVDMWIGTSSGGEISWYDLGMSSSKLAFVNDLCWDLGCFKWYASSSPNFSYGWAWIIYITLNQKASWKIHAWSSPSLLPKSKNYRRDKYVEQYEQQSNNIVLKIMFKTKNWNQGFHPPKKNTRIGMMFHISIIFQKFSTWGSRQGQMNCCDSHGNSRDLQDRSSNFAQGLNLKLLIGGYPPWN